MKPILRVMVVTDLPEKWIEDNLDKDTILLIQRQYDRTIVATDYIIFYIFKKVVMNMKGMKFDKAYLEIPVCEDVLDFIIRPMVETMKIIYTYQN